MGESSRQSLVLSSNALFADRDHRINGGMVRRARCLDLPVWHLPIGAVLVRHHTIATPAQPLLPLSLNISERYLDARRRGAEAGEVPVGAGHEVEGVQCRRDVGIAKRSILFRAVHDQAATPAFATIQSVCRSISARSVFQIQDGMHALFFCNSRADLTALRMRFWDNVADVDPTIRGCSRDPAAWFHTLCAHPTTCATLGKFAFDVLQLFSVHRPFSPPASAWVAASDGNGNQDGGL